MGLVDYSSGESADEEEPPKKRLRNADADSEPDGSGAKTDVKADGHGRDAGGDLPPLPSAFHDLYASTVRQSVSDDPSLHQGRKRLTPHVPGNWPSHIYVEWNPTSKQHEMLTSLLSHVEKELNNEVELHSLLTSDLGAPLPLHVSLSRPLSLRTGDKDAFLDRVTAAVQSSGVHPFAVTPCGLAWYKSPDSDRAFLILRVAAPGAPVKDASMDADADPDSSPLNPQLLTLLTRCNGTATFFGQQPLYQKTPSAPVGTAFHISLAWSFGLPGSETSFRSLKVLKQKRFADVRAWRIDVPGVKVKIGNAVHHVSLDGRRGSTRS